MKYSKRVTVIELENATFAPGDTKFFMVGISDKW